MHTPGPWLQSSTVLICNEEARVIANCTPLKEIPELSIPFRQVDANARLIAAAPEMLEVLQKLRAYLAGRSGFDCWHGEDCRAYTAITVAIEHATKSPRPE